MCEQKAVGSDPGKVYSVSRSGKAYLLFLVVVGSGVEHVPDTLVLYHGRSFDAAHLPVHVRLQEGTFRRKEGPFVWTVITSIGSFSHAEQLVSLGLVPGCKHQDHLVFHSVDFGVD